MLASKPLANFKGNPSRIPAGKWRISCLDLKDSVVAVETRGSPLAGKISRITPRFKIEGPEIVSLSFLNAGTEKELTIYAERIDGPEPSDSD
jgi:hypothetical protein